MGVAVMTVDGRGGVRVAGGMTVGAQVDVAVNVTTGVREDGVVDNGGTGDVTVGVVMGGLPVAALMRSEMMNGDTDVLDKMVGKLGGATEEGVATSDLSLGVVMVEPDLMLDEMMLDNLLSEMMMDDGELDMLERCPMMDDSGLTMLDEALMDDDGMDLVDEMMTDRVGEMEDGRSDLLGEVMMDELEMVMARDLRLMDNVMAVLGGVVPSKPAAVTRDEMVGSGMGLRDMLDPDLMLDKMMMGNMLDEMMMGDYGRDLLDEMVMATTEVVALMWDEMMDDVVDMLDGMLTPKLAAVVARLPRRVRWQRRSHEPRRPLPRRPLPRPPHLPRRPPRV